MTMRPAPPVILRDDPRSLHFFRTSSNPPSNETAWALTGGHRFRRAWWGAVVLQVEEYRMAYRPTTLRREDAAWIKEYRWRGARLEDLGSVSMEPPA